MKFSKLILSALLVAFSVSLANAQVVRRTEADKAKDKKTGSHVTERQQSFYEVKEPSDADLQWMKVIYRQLDLTKGKNPALYYPEEPNEDGQSLFFIIMRLLANNEIKAYEYLDGREMFTDEFQIKVGEMLDRFHILYSNAKGSTEKNPKYSIEDADIPGNEILSYYIIEKWEFDTRTNSMKARVEAICPVLHRQDEFGGEAIRYPMFWVKLNEIRPYMAQQYVFTDDDNNLQRYNLDDFFKLNMYSGEIYKVKNLRNLSLRQQFPDEEAYKHAQDSIETRLRMFDKNLWVPSREELLAQKKATEGEVEGDDAATEGDDSSATKDEKAKDEKKSVRTTKRGSSKSDGGKKSNTKVKTRTKTKSSGGSSGATRSVRNRKKK
ncbi:MAG: gliding motility protein GldN [Muribaculaceae bacterium]|nr:gliding motility protein GldN [Muribaculaceae bacterium]